jgi:hypothetical protein
MKKSRSVKRKVLILLGVVLGLIVVSNAVLLALAGNIETWLAGWKTWLGLLPPP